MMLFLSSESYQLQFIDVSDASHYHSLKSVSTKPNYMRMISTQICNQKCPTLVNTDVIAISSHFYILLFFFFRQVGCVRNTKVL